jgi:regulator of sigma E protease
VEVIIFLIILAALVFVHELGHFLAAKLFGIRVDEFALGFPPQLWSKKFGETTYAINLIPFGGYVKIYGENPDDESISGEDSRRSLVNKSKWIQAGVLIAGICFNILFAWVLVSTSLAFGLSADRSDVPARYINNAHLAIIDVEKDSPAAKAGLLAGDSLISLSSTNGSIFEGTLTLAGVQDFIATSGKVPITFDYQQGSIQKSVVITPALGIVPGKAAVGIEMDMLGTIKMPFYVAPYYGAKVGWHLVEDTATGLYRFFKGIVIGHADFSQVSGPVGLVGMVGEASRFGFGYLLGFTALISINLALINLIPFPALDGGRILFVIIEAFKGSPIKPKIQNTFNAVGFALLILLMLVVTYKDVANLFVK